MVRLGGDTSTCVYPMAANRGSSAETSSNLQLKRWTIIVASATASPSPQSAFPEVSSSATSDTSAGSHPTIVVASDNTIAPELLNDIYPMVFPRGSPRTAKVATLTMRFPNHAGKPVEREAAENDSRNLAQPEIVRPRTVRRKEAIEPHSASCVREPRRRPVRLCSNRVRFSPVHLELVLATYPDQALHPKWTPHGVY